MIQDSAIFSWDVNVTFDDHLKPLKFSGSKLDDRYLIIALETNSDVPFLYEELLRINNEQSNYIRTILKERFLETQVFKEHEEAYEELSKVNNELANLQRELFKKNKELSRLNEIKNQFIGMAAHDLRNPLGNIFNFAELLEEEKDELSEEHNRYIHQIRNQSRFMLKLVEDLLDYSTIESGKINLVKKEYQIGSIISNTIKLASGLAKRKNIHVTFTNSDSKISLLCDKDKMEQVVMNLVTNAIKFSESDTHVTIHLSKLDNQIEVVVIDEGQGIAKEEAMNLFKPFGRTSTKSTAGEKSTGLGLFICKKIIEAHGGEIGVNTTLGKGSSFYFKIPLNMNNQ